MRCRLVQKLLWLPLICLLSFAPLPSQPLSCQGLEGRLKSANGAAPDAPPALAAPGFKWVLVREGQEASAASAAAAGGGGAGAGPSRQGSSAAMSAAGAEPPSATAAAAEEEGVRVGGSLLWGGLRGGQPGSGSSGGRPRDQQVAALLRQISELEATRDRLAEELVAAATEAAAGQAAQAAARRAAGELADLQASGGQGGTGPAAYGLVASLAGWRGALVHGVWSGASGIGC